MVVEVVEGLVVVTTGSLVGEGEEEEEEEEGTTITTMEEEGTTITTMEEGEEEEAGPMTGGTDAPTYFRRLRTYCKTE